MGTIYTPVWKNGSFAGIGRIENDIVGRVNALRRSRRIAPLQIDERLRTAARQHAIEMGRRNYYAHTSPIAAHRTVARRACLAGFLDPFVAENIGYTTDSNAPSDALMKSWTTSASHYATMVDPRYTHVGIGVAAAMKGGKTLYYATQVFAAAPVDLRNLAIAAARKRVLRVSAELTVGHAAKVIAYKGQQYLGEIRVAGGKAVFSHDLAMPQGTSTAFHFGIMLPQENNSIACASVSVDGQGKLTMLRNTQDALCKAVSHVAASAVTLTTQVASLKGEARANATVAPQARYYLNRTWGSPLSLSAGRWMPFSVALPRTRTVTFALLVDRVLKHYLTIDPSKKNPFICP